MTECTKERVAEPVPRSIRTVGTPCSRANLTSSARRASAWFPGSTWSANFALLSVYSCAQYTSVSFGSTTSFCRLSHICAGDPSNRRPQPMLNSVSPGNSALLSGKYSVMWPLVCPGVSKHTSLEDPTEYSSPSASATSIPGIRSRSAFGPTTVALKRSFSSRFPPVWSQWWCVLSTCVSVQFCAARVFTIGSTSAGSTTAVAPVCSSCTSQE